MVFLFVVTSLGYVEHRIHDGGVGGSSSRVASTRSAFPKYSDV